LLLAVRLPPCPFDVGRVSAFSYSIFLAFETCHVQLRDRKIALCKEPARLADLFAAIQVTGGLERIEDGDLIAAFHGERDAALWQLAQEWPSVVQHCFDANIWSEVRATCYRHRRLISRTQRNSAAHDVTKSLPRFS